MRQALRAAWGNEKMGDFDGLAEGIIGAPQWEGEPLAAPRQVACRVAQRSKESESMQVTRALTVGKWAYDHLGRPGFTAKVIAAGSRAIYLEGRAGEILWLSPPGSVLHRRCVVVPLTSGSWKEGDVCFSDGDTLCGGRSDGVCWSGADVWEAPPPGGEALPPATPSVTPEESAAALAGGLSALSLRYPPRGLAELVFGVAPGGQRLGRAGGQMGGWLDLSSDRVGEVVRALRARDCTGLLASGRTLLGFGEGLTPSGDDFLGGVLFGLRQQESADFDETWIDWDVVRDWVADVVPLTNRISHAILSDLAEGYGPEPLHDLARETLRGGSREVVARHAERVIRIGSTSGWDLLAGFSAALLGGVALARCLECPVSESCRQATTASHFGDLGALCVMRAIGTSALPFTASAQGSPGS